MTTKTTVEAVKDCLHLTAEIRLQVRNGEEGSIVGGWNAEVSGRVEMTKIKLAATPVLLEAAQGVMRAALGAFMQAHLVEMTESLLELQCVAAEQGLVEVKE